MGERAVAAKCGFSWGPEMLARPTDAQSRSVCTGAYTSTSNLGIPPLLHPAQGRRPRTNDLGAALGEGGQQAVVLAGAQGLEQLGCIEEQQRVACTVGWQGAGRTMRLYGLCANFGFRSSTSLGSCRVPVSARKAPSMKHSAKWTR